MSLFLIRHASAGTRGVFGGDDLDRPLDAIGHDQATAIAAMLAERGVTAVYASRATRCIETVSPLAEAIGAGVEVHPALVEGQSAVAAIALLRHLAANGTVAALCSHGDIIPDAIERLAREGMVIAGVRGWAKGSTWEIEVRGTDLVRASFLGPF